jgi:hypothetical protein
MMRAWGNRPDTVVCDEPLYAHYLRVTGLDHPGAAEVVAHHESNLERVIADLLAPLPEGASIFYQKHMAHHLLPDVPRAWLDEVTSAFLIREPADMLISLAQRLPNPRLEDTGLPQQVEIFERVKARTGATPPVVDARDVLADPRRMLGLLCDAVEAPFSERMLSWPPGIRPTDGVWARHWYDAVVRSTGWHPYHAKDEAIPDSLRGVELAARECYEVLWKVRLR